MFHLSYARYRLHTISLQHSKYSPKKIILPFPCTYDQTKYSAKNMIAVFHINTFQSSIPVVLNNGQDLARKLALEDDIGIVPCSVIPWYCSRFFPDENILDFINLPDETPDEIIKASVWKPIQVFSLNNK